MPTWRVEEQITCKRASDDQQFFIMMSRIGCQSFYLQTQPFLNLVFQWLSVSEMGQLCTGNQEICNLRVSVKCSIYSAGLSGRMMKFLSGQEQLPHAYPCTKPCKDTSIINNRN